ncbi:MAG TPA: hypothetical protein VK470_12600 [Bacteroidota bacterium]|nr:hypothetical protein [Bacteroidota bacterium]
MRENVHDDGGGTGHGGNTGGDTSPAVSVTAIDLSRSGMLIMNGEESADFLQRLSTNNFRTFNSGAALQTVLTDEKGRIIDVVIAVHRGASIMLLTSPGRSEAVKTWLERFIIMEDITIDEETGQHACVAITGDDSEIGRLVSSAEPAPHDTLVTLIPFSYYSIPATLAVSNSTAHIQSLLASRHISLLMPEMFDDFRIAHGIPAPGKEIVEKTNPLEAGLRGIVDFSKGCYIGQEVIARLNTYEKVQRLLCRVRVSSRPPVDASAEVIGEEGGHGYITTLGRNVGDDGSVDALAMIRAASAVQGACFTFRDTNIQVVVESIL